MRAARQTPWLFSRTGDLAAFGGPLLLSLALLVVGIPLGLVTGDGDHETPPIAWLALVVGVDVAHVWGNLLLVYADPSGFQRPRAFWLALPAVVAALAWAVASESELALWRTVAALAVFHFVRQQVGWVKLYRARGEDPPGALRILDEGAAYAATLGPLLWWHAHLPRPFSWLAEGDFFLALPAWVGTLALGVEALWLALYALHSARAHMHGRGSPGKDLVVCGTAISWWLGIVAFESDYVFTVTNVLGHGLPYVLLIADTARRRRLAGLRILRPFRLGIGGVALTLVACGYVEEGLWDRLLWHEHGAFFPGPSIGVESLRAPLMAFLVAPQLLHYVLDGLLWKRRHNPHFM
ncbi:MAG: hypothetical protein RL385_596 [Pseudomonadota bacterium]